MNTKHIILMACTALLGVIRVSAQRQNLSILAVDTDARAATMDSASAATEGMYLYNNPAAIFAANKEFAADISAALFEKTEGVEGAFAIYTLSAGYKLAKCHTVFAGFRYAGGLSPKDPDLLGNPTKDYKPYNWTLDLGYTYFLGGGLAAYVAGSLIYGRLSKNATDAAFGADGAYRNNELTLASKPTNLMLDARVGAIGPQLDYDNKHKTTLPIYLAVSGALPVEVAEKCRVAAALFSRHLFQSLGARLFMPGGGLGYTYNKITLVRAGYGYGNHDPSHITMDAGFRYHGLRLSGAYNLKAVDAGSSHCIVDIGYDL